MHSFKTGYLLLLGLVLAIPACFKIQKDGDDDDDSSGGSSGNGGTTSVGGTAGRGGTSSVGGTFGAGGSSGTSASSGTGGSSSTVGGSCDTSSFKIPNLTCPSGGVYELSNATCQTFFLCFGVATCNEEGLDCASCLSELQSEFMSSDATTDLCVSAGTSQSELSEACVLASEDSSNPYPSCAQ